MSTPYTTTPILPPGVAPKVIGPDRWAKEQKFIVTGHSTRALLNSRWGNDIEDLRLGIGPPLYRKMENDPTVNKIKQILITGALAEHLMLMPGQNEDEAAPDQSEFEKFVYVQAFAQDVLDGLDRPYREIMKQMMSNAIPYGHGIAEVDWEPRVANLASKGLVKTTPPPKGTMARLRQRVGDYMHARVRTMLSLSLKANLASKPVGRPPAEYKMPKLKPNMYLMPECIRVLPHGSALFVWNEYREVMGLVPGWHRTYNTLHYNEVISRDKFLVLTMNETDGDPRGLSEYRSIVTQWDFKQHIPREYLLFLLQEALPTAIGTLPENSEKMQFERGPDGNIIYEDGVFNEDGSPVARWLSASESMALQIRDMRGGTGVVIPFDAKLEPFRKHEVKGDVFGQAMKVANSEMQNGVLLQELAQGTTDGQSKSASETHANVLFMKHFMNRYALAAMTLYDLIAVAVKINLGDWALSYMPKISLGDSVPRDWAYEFSVVADAYFKGLVDDSQRPPIMSEFGMPKPGVSRAEQDRQAGITTTNPVDPKSGTPAPKDKNRPDKQTGQKTRNDGNTKKSPSVDYGPFSKRTASFVHYRR